MGGPPDGGLHVPTKDAAHSFARAAAVALRDRGIRCNAVCPGFTGPPHGLREVADLQAPGVDMSEPAIATARGCIGTPVEVAQAALPLASDTASFGNGAHLFVEKGFAPGGGGRKRCISLVETNTWLVHSKCPNRNHASIQNLKYGEGTK